MSDKQHVMGAAAEAPEPALSASPTEPLCVSSLPGDGQAHGALATILGWYAELPAQGRKGLSFHHLHTLSKQLRNCSQRECQELVDVVREECAKVCDRHNDLPLCRELAGDQGRGAFYMASHLATDVRSASFHDNERIERAIANPPLRWGFCLRCNRHLPCGPDGMCEKCAPALEASSRQEERPPKRQALIDAAYSELPRERWPCANDESAMALALGRQRKWSADAVKAALEPPHAKDAADV